MGNQRKDRPTPELIRSLAQTSINHRYTHIGDCWFKRLKRVRRRRRRRLTNHPRYKAIIIIPSRNSRLQFPRGNQGRVEEREGERVAQVVLSTKHSEKDGTSFVTGWIVICTSCLPHDRQEDHHYIIWDGMGRGGHLDMCKCSCCQSHKLAIHVPSCWAIKAFNW